jgi:hypothetical protein
MWQQLMINALKPQTSTTTCNYFGNTLRCSHN